MSAVFIFSLTLIATSLLSSLAQRSVLSTAVVFLAVGFLTGPGMGGWIPFDANSRAVSIFAELALFAILYTEGMQLDVDSLRRYWRLPLRAIVLGMPLTILVIAVFAHYLAGLTWLQAGLLGAILSPTDPVFASALTSKPEVPARLRHFLNIESGLNDGLALPAVLLLLSLAQGRHENLLVDGAELAGGVAIGTIVAWLAVALRRIPFLSLVSVYERIYAFAIALLIYSLASLTGGNLFLAAFNGGICVATLAPEVKREFCPLGEPIAELLKLAGVMAFGAMISPQLLGDIAWPGYAFALAAVLVARPLAVGLLLVFSRMPWKETLTALWFGPKGFASLLYAYWVLRADIDGAEQIFRLAGVTIGLSIAHSSTDVLVARVFDSSSAATSDRTQAHQTA
jgi:NhaP-type Na+/H+ or K+/H+ antiporter